MIVSLVSKGSLLKGASLLSGATAVTSYGAYTAYDSLNYPDNPHAVDDSLSSEDDHMKISDKEIDSNNYKDPSPVRLCVKKLFDDVEIPESKSPEPKTLEVQMNKDDFFTKIEKTKEGCFNMKTENKENGDVVGFAELTAIAENYGLIMQSEINLKQVNPGSKSYFFNKLLFLEKNNSKWIVQKVIAFEKIPTFGGGDPIKNKKPNEVVDSPKISIKLWSQVENQNNEFLFQQFDFKIATDFWKIYRSSSFNSSTEGEAYMNGKWYKDSKTNTDKTWHNRIPKGKWTNVTMNELCQQDDLKNKDFCSKHIK